MLWQLRKISTSEALSPAGELPNNWGPIFGLAGVQDRIGDLSWLGDAYSDKGWFQLTESEEHDFFKQKVDAELSSLKAEANNTIGSSGITVEQKKKWLEYLIMLDKVPFHPDYPKAVPLPAKPVFSEI